MNPIFMRLPPDLTVSGDNILIGRQLVQADRPARVELLRRDAHLAAEAEFAAVREARRGVDIDGRAVHPRREAGGAFLASRDDGLAVVRGMLRNMSTLSTTLTARI